MGANIKWKRAQERQHQHRYMTAELRRKDKKPIGSRRAKALAARRKSMMQP